jgi:MYXO-CTERM domain-containing protein
MTRLNQLTFALGVLAVQLLAPSARADSARSDDCGPAGEACSLYLSPGVNKEGRCFATQCNACDGKKVTKFPCQRCEVADGGAGGVTDKPDAVPDCSHEEGGCSVPQAGTETGIGIGMLAIGIAALGGARRRRR